MTDQPSTNPSGRLGSVLSAVGFAWLLLSILAGMDVLSEIGLPTELIAGLRGNILPAVVLIVAGRSMRKRARRRVEKEEPKPARPAQRPQQRPQPPPLPRPKAPRTEPAAHREPSPKATAQRRDVVSLEEALAELESDAEPAEEPLPPSDSDQPASPKTSEEMLEEARRKWGSDRG